ncbi:MAG: 4-alpha-glucanotransferase [Saprospiraceae bacterium]|nr:4-alpha-glucanotransferase [Saprospiraceae bacterium]MDW8484137.1 4-alpha-glucanotransferase [Saprospiraceae bacterium]
MSVHFYLYYTTQFGENLYVIVQIQSGANIREEEHLLNYLNDRLWHNLVTFDVQPGEVLRYHYEWRNGYGHRRVEECDRELIAGDVEELVEVYDCWEPMGAVENVFDTQAFRVLVPRSLPSGRARKNTGWTHCFRVKVPLLPPDEVVCLLGHGRALRNWDTAAPILLQPDDQGWSISLDLSDEAFPLGYKYGLWNTRTRTFSGFEKGSNRVLYQPHPTARYTILHDGFMRLPPAQWRGAGVAIPVFSLRSERSFGVGDFADLMLLIDWAAQVGLRLIQLLPVNDTSATGTWTDSYPYSAISAFALHPLYLSLEEVAGETYAALLEPYAEQRKALNGMESLNYEAVLQTKWTIIRQLFEAQKEAFLQNPAFKHYFSENREWLVPYAAFCFLRDKYGTCDFSKWQEYATYRPSAIEKLTAPTSKHYDAIAIHYFVQWHLHRQLRSAADYAHARGIILKGDIPIGIYRYSCDAWVAPELYNMDMQAGAPPDDFALHGQNWGFPTYHWARMKENRYAWWRQRFEQMSRYFDAFRIDHILGFFRIWSIPWHATQGILGHFVPAVPLVEEEFHRAGIGFNYERLCKPYITDTVLQSFFGEYADAVRDFFLERTPDAGHWSGGGQYAFKPAFDTQRKIEEFWALATASSTESKKKPAGRKKPDPKALPPIIREGLLALHANVILLDVTPPGAQEKAYAFRIEMEKTLSFQVLPQAVKGPLKELYVDYFYRRQDALWQREAMEKLPALKRATRMLVCGEDLGMVPHCVPEVMRELGILSLEVQRMPKTPGQVFFNLKDAPYLSVVTPSTHDMSTLRGWWEENRELTQRFFNEVLGYAGTAPFFCEPWVCRVILNQHLHSPAMWAIFQLQDLLSIDGALRRQNPHDERINIPANPNHYWRYRMHLTLEALQKADAFNAELQQMIVESGRG